MTNHDPNRTTNQPPEPAPPDWRQLHITFTATDRQTIERAAATGLGDALADTENKKLITSWFFMRKQPWKLRYLPVDDTTASPADAILQAAADALRQAGHATRWCHGIYEPETHAFGGNHGMAATHTLFHADSRHIFDHLTSPPAHHSDQRRELSILLCTALMNSAGLDRYERGDVWARISAVRPEPTVPADRQGSFNAAIERLISTDTAPHTAWRRSAPQPVNSWLSAFELAGRHLRTYADEGQLTRGLRAVTAHLIIFHWNRMGLPNQTQANIAHTANKIIFEN
ncbi:thiopeptide-type bacteriocin biosynthesis protein [Frankia sp. ACN10a]|uniref:thiopeptide-type bacteriocin biosynthesis protein n=1 Tax=Frankia sp. ACN10a TaxID=2926031 RepID=UPI00211803EC|nr:thiopeptide-type bacteriocin biosynthesis protein [Frankia sp. ACN10a]